MKHRSIYALLLCLSIGTSASAQMVWLPVETLEAGTKLCLHEFLIIEWIDQGGEPPAGCERIKEEEHGSVDLRAPYPVKVPLGDLFTFTRIMPNGETAVRFGIRYYGEPA